MMFISINCALGILPTLSLIHTTILEINTSVSIFLDEKIESRKTRFAKGYILNVDFLESKSLWL